MNGSAIKSYTTPIILVGSGDVAWEPFKALGASGYPVIGIDGGADALIGAGYRPSLVLGDMDSLDRTLLDVETEIIEIAEQETTDFEKALYSIEAPLFIAFGFWGDRLDHCLAALHVLTKYRAEKTVILVDRSDLLFNPGGTIDLPLGVGTRLSIYPLAKTHFEASTGLAYSLDGRTLEAGDAIGVSNETNRDICSITPLPADGKNYALVVAKKHIQTLVGELGKDRS